jgi:hypothetical protein
MKFGIFKARAVLGTEQFGETSNGHPQLALMFRMKIDDHGSTQEASTFLIFSPESAPYSYERLRACGWEGNDLTDLKGVDKNEVDLKIWEDSYQGKPQVKVEIMGGGKVTMAKPLSKEAFAAKVKALTGGGGAPATGGSRPPF